MALLCMVNSLQGLDTSNTFAASKALLPLDWALSVLSIARQGSSVQMESSICAIDLCVSLHLTLIILAQRLGT